MENTNTKVQAQAQSSVQAQVQAPAQQGVQADMPKMDERQKQLFLKVSKEFGDWNAVIATLQNVANEKTLENDPSWDLCRKAAKKLGVNWQELANLLFWEITRCGIVHGNEPQILNQILYPILNYGLNPFIQGELHIVKFGTWFQCLIGINGIYRLTSEDPRFLNSECTFSQEMVQVGMVDIVKKGEKLANNVSFPKLCPVSCTCRITFKDKDGQIRETSKTRFLSDCWRNSSAWFNSPAEMLSARAFTSAAKVVLGLAMSDEGWLEEPKTVKPSVQPAVQVQPSVQPASAVLEPVDLEIDLG